MQKPPAPRLLRLAGTLALAALCLALPARLAGADDDAPPVPAPAKPAAPAKAPDKVLRPLLWMVKRTPPVFLFGTIHVPDDRVTELPEVVKTAFDGVDAVRTEIKMDMASLMAMQVKVMQDGKFAGERKLADLLGEALYARLEMVVTHPMLRMQLPNSRPWLALILIAQDMMMQKYGMAFPLDKQLYDRGAAAGKDMDGLEQIDAHLGVFSKLEEQEQVELLTQAVAQVEKAREAETSPLEELVGLYLRGDEQALSKKLLEDEMMGGDDPLSKKLYKRLLPDRNEIMAKGVRAFLEAHPDKSLFVAVGAAHLPGKQGLVAMLRASGLTVERLELGDTARVKAAFAAKPAETRKREPVGAGG